MRTKRAPVLHAFQDDVEEDDSEIEDLYGVGNLASSPPSEEYNYILDSGDFPSTCVDEVAMATPTGGPPWDGRGSAAQSTWGSPIAGGQSGPSRLPPPSYTESLGLGNTPSTSASYSGFGKALNMPVVNSGQPQLRNRSPQSEQAHAASLSLLRQMAANPYYDHLNQPEFPVPNTLSSQSSSCSGHMRGLPRAQGTMRVEMETQSQHHSVDQSTASRLPDIAAGYHHMMMQTHMQQNPPQIRQSVPPISQNPSQIHQSTPQINQSAPQIHPAFRLPPRLYPALAQAQQPNGPSQQGRMPNPNLHLSDLHANWTPGIQDPARAAMHSQRLRAPGSFQQQNYRQPDISNLQQPRFLNPTTLPEIPSLQRAPRQAHYHTVHHPAMQSSSNQSPVFNPSSSCQSFNRQQTLDYNNASANSSSMSPTAEVNRVNSHLAAGDENVKKVGFFLHCRQLYEHYLRTCSSNGEVPAPFHEFCEVYMQRCQELRKSRRSKEQSNNKENTDVQTASSDKPVEDEPSDKSILGQWYRLPESEQEEVSSLRLQTSTHSQSSGSPEGNTRIKEPTQTQPPEKMESTEIFINVKTEPENVNLTNTNADPDTDLNTCGKDDGDKSSEETSDVKDDSTNQEIDEARMKIKFPFPSKTPKNKGSSVENNKKKAFSVSDHNIQKLSRVVSEVMENIKKKKMDSESDVQASSAESMMQIEPLQEDINSITPPLFDGEDVTTDTAVVSENQNGEQPCAQSLTGVSKTKRKRNPTEVDPANPLISKDNITVPPNSKKFKLSGETAAENNVDIVEESTEGILIEGNKNIPETSKVLEKYADGEELNRPVSILRETQPFFFIRFHGEKLLCVNTDNGQCLLMREILKKCFSSLGKRKESDNKHFGTAKYYKIVYLAKERDLNIPYVELPETKRDTVNKYMSETEVLKSKKTGKHIGIIHVNDAHRLYQYFFGLKLCSDGCIQPWESLEKDTGNSENVSHNQNLSTESCDQVLTNSSENKQSHDQIVTINQDGCSAKEKLVEEIDGNESDATIPYMEDSDDDVIQIDCDDASSQDEEPQHGEISKNWVQNDKNARQNEQGEEDLIPISIDPMNENFISTDTATGEENISNFDEQIQDCQQHHEDIDNSDDFDVYLKGGVAPVYGGLFRFLVIEGEKFYPFVDLTNKFETEDLLELMKLRQENKYKAYKCSMMEAEFLNRLEPSLPELSENAAILEEAIFFDIARKKCLLLSGEIDLTLDEDDPDTQQKNIESVNDLVQGQTVIENNQTIAEKDTPLSHVILPTDDIKQDKANEMSMSIDKEISKEQGDSKAVKYTGSSEAADPGLNSSANRQVEADDSYQTNEVSSTVNTPVGEEKTSCRTTRDRRLSVDTSVAQESVVGSSSIDASMLPLVDEERNNNSQSAEDAMFAAHLMEKIKSSLSNSQSDPRSEEINRDMEQFFKACQETCTESQKIITRTFISVWKQNLTLKDELNELRTSINGLREGKEALEAAGRRCDDIIAKMQETKSTLLGDTESQ